MRLWIKIEMDNAAFANEMSNVTEVTRILRKLRTEFAERWVTRFKENEYGPLFDINGNNVGFWKVEGNDGEFPAEED